jgi:hypothetical protein
VECLRRVVAAAAAMVHGDGDVAVGAMCDFGPNFVPKFGRESLLLSLHRKEWYLIWSQTISKWQPSSGKWRVTSTQDRSRRSIHLSTHYGMVRTIMRTRTPIPIPIPL